MYVRGYQPNLEDNCIYKKETMIEYNKIKIIEWLPPWCDAHLYLLDKGCKNTSPSDIVPAITIYNTVSNLRGKLKPKPIKNDTSTCVNRSTHQNTYPL